MRLNITSLFSGSLGLEPMMPPLSVHDAKIQPLRLSMPGSSQPVMRSEYVRPVPWNVCFSWHIQSGPVQPGLL
ncbi:MAG TPA: hypothetical protein VF549_00560 [Solirubrobacteraceae bacterium]